jgi:hypothetical protein
MGMEIDFYFGRTVFMEKRSYISILVWCMEGSV